MFPFDAVRLNGSDIPSVPNPLHHSFVYLALYIICIYVFVVVWPAFGSQPRKICWWFRGWIVGNQKARFETRLLPMVGQWANRCRINHINRETVRQFTLWRSPLCVTRFTGSTCPPQFSIVKTLRCLSKRWSVEDWKWREGEREREGGFGLLWGRGSRVEFDHSAKEKIEAA